ncbi:hypothetical protein BDV25DRAFT_3223 [Aspergillus avenaceus]|uniref:Uncharacterized protein n=1 Tax=Aspergillus avenaceus TaxID=36643 RepID=A0A5N6TSM1_ASPAV|nr:hypothetical protein BDV25DRAFT_3223 [Aspergillus avenaceus]
MSLKRKASFSGLPLTNATPVNTEMSMTMEDSPKHLNSRTRKRYRDDRPDEKVIYENTLRWLYTAQERQGQPPAADEDQIEDLESATAIPTEIIDPRQQTLHKFFQPSRFSTIQPRPNQIDHKPDIISRVNSLSLRRHDSETDSNVPSLGSDSTTPSSQDITTDMELAMD